MKNTITGLILVLGLFTSLNIQSQEIRSIKSIKLKSINTDKAVDLSQLAPATNWVLIILNTDLYVSQQMLEALQDKNADLSKTVIMLIENHYDQQVRKNNYLKFQEELAPHNWVFEEHSAILDELKIVGTPVVLGIVEDKIAWQITGLPSKRDFNRVASRINNWSNIGN